MTSSGKSSQETRPVREILHDFHIDNHVMGSNILIVRHDLQALKRMRQEGRDKEIYRPNGNYDYLLKANGN